MTTKDKKTKDVLKLLNKEVARLYKIYILYGIINLVVTVCAYLFIEVGYGLVCTVSTLVTIFVIRSVKKSVKINIGIIYLNHKELCKTLNFFQIYDENIIKCYVGVIDLRLSRSVLRKRARDRILYDRSI